MTEKLIQDIIQWDVRSWSKALHYWDKTVNWSSVGNALELGGREGGLSLWLALKGIPVICSDLENVKQTALPLHSKYPVKNLITYEDLNALALPYENHFDIIVFKSIIGGIGRKDSPGTQQKVFDEIYKALKPGGKLLFAENMKASALHQKSRQLFTEWKDYWHYVPAEDMKAYLQAFSSFTMRFTGFLGTFGRNERQKQILAAADDVIFNWSCPDSWKYIAYGIAVK
ncbi:MAG: methyltransferase domain-containing protein [Bacteroidota bacterium]